MLSGRLILPEGNLLFANGLAFELLVGHAKGRFLVPVSFEPIGTRLHLSTPAGLLQRKPVDAWDSLKTSGFFCPMDRVSSP